MTEGLCECGCGHKTTIAKENNKRRGWVKGRPIRFIHGHQHSGENNWQWHGGRRLSQGYAFIKAPENPRADEHGYVSEHILIAEHALGKRLPCDALIHHVDENGLNNKNGNLVICQNIGYHKLLHQRMRALSACGHAAWRKCKFCKKYDDTTKMVQYRNQTMFHHKECAQEYQRSNYAGGNL